MKRMIYAALACVGMSSAAVSQEFLPQARTHRPRPAAKAKATRTSDDVLVEVPAPSHFPGYIVKVATEKICELADKHKKYDLQFDDPMDQKRWEDQLRASQYQFLSMTADIPHYLDGTKPNNILGGYRYSALQIVGLDLKKDKTVFRFRRNHRADKEYLEACTRIGTVYTPLGDVCVVTISDGQRVIKSIKVQVKQDSL